MAALGGLLFGFDTAVISGTTSALETIFDLDAKWLGFTVASALLGTIVGSIAVGRPSDHFGRKNVLLVLAVFFTVSAVGSGLAWDWCSFMFFRFLGGLGVGGASVVSPMYIAEISPAKIRAKGQALGSFSVWVAAALVSQAFPMAAESEYIGPGNSFAFFAVMMALHFIFVWRVLPETKGISLEQIQKQLEIE